MGTITTKDGVEIFYKDWGKGQPVVFSHGWPLSADDWDTQMLFFLKHGYRVIAHDRRGHGRSTQVGDGHDMDHYVDDLAALTEHLDLKDAVHVGHSTGGGEVVHYLARHGESRVAKAAIMWEPFVAWGTLLALLWYFRTQVNPERFRHLGRRAYAIYCFHPPIVVGFSLALRTWAAPEALKFLAVGTLSCVTLYLTCGLLLRIPLVARVW